MTFAHRAEAGRRLAALVARRCLDDVVVLGLPRGGMPVAAEVAAVLRAPLDVLPVRRLTAPSRPELAFGAIGEDGVRVINRAAVRSLRLNPDEIAAVEVRERAELVRLSRRYRDGGASLSLEGRTAVIVDDGVATGATAHAACLIARQRGAEGVVLAVPVAPRGWTRRLREVADDLICLDEPRRFYAVGQFYDDFPATTDEEVRGILRQAAEAVERVAT